MTGQMPEAAAQKCIAALLKFQEADFNQAQGRAFARLEMFTDSWFFRGLEGQLGHIRSEET
jgi:hypothetical protein